MLPDIAAEDRGAGALGDAGHERVVLVWGGADAEGLVGFHAEPDPATAKAGEAGGFELGLEVVEASECGIDGISQSAGWSAACGWAHEIPEKGVVPVSAAIIAHGSTDRLRHVSEIADEFFDGLRSQIRSALEGLVEIRNISRVVLAVMDLHRACVDIGFKRRGGVGKSRKFEGHDILDLRTLKIAAMARHSSGLLHPSVDSTRERD